jgi:hypothetical protein
MANMQIRDVVIFCAWQLHAYVLFIHAYRDLAEAELNLAKADRDVANAKLKSLKAHHTQGLQLATAER